MFSLTHEGIEAITAEEQLTPRSLSFGGISGYCGCRATKGGSRTVQPVSDAFQKRAG